MRDVTFKAFAAVAKRRGHTPESLAELFRGMIEEPREFFERVMACRYKGENRSGVVLPYRNVIEWYRKEVSYFMDASRKQRVCLCGCGAPVFDRKKWATPGCRQRVARGNVTDAHFASLEVPEIIDAKV